MNRVLLIAALFIFYLAPKVQAQYGNEWINTSQTYYKFPVTADGWYHIPYAALEAVFGASLSTISTNEFTLYHNGNPVPLFISSSTTIGVNDYISFYGQHNIGDLDSVLYRSGALQPHPYYSLFNDTAYYYLTVQGATQSHSFFTQVNYSLNNPPAAEPYFIYPDRQLYTGQNTQGFGQYLDGEEVWSPVFDNGEGYADLNFIGVFPYSSTNQLQSKTYNFSTPNAYQGSGTPQSSLYTVFANYSPAPDVHALTYNVNSSTVYSQGANQVGFQLNKITAPFATSVITSNSTNVTISAQSTAATSYEQNVIYMNELDYPRTFNFAGLNAFHFQLAAGNVQRFLQISNFASNGYAPTLFDLTTGSVYQSIQPVNSNPLEFLIGGNGSSYAGPHDLYLISNDPTSYNSITSLTPTVFQDYTSLLTNCDYAIITDSSLMVDVDGNGVDEVTDYAHHRDANYNPFTGKYHPEVFVMSQLYDQFAYGVKKSPLAIRNFIQYALHKYNKLKYVFLIGKGYQYPDMRTGGPRPYSECLVPTFGQPAGDNLLAATRFSYVPTVALGRLAATSAQQLYAYRRKITVYDSLQTYSYVPCMDIPDKIWQKQVLHFSGGTDFTEQVIFRQYLANYAAIAEDTSWGANVTAYSKVSSAPISQTESAIIQGQIDSGTSLVTFFGHASTGGFDFSINEPENYTNYNKYPVILSNGCFSGDIFESATTAITASYSERFVLEPNIGAIAFIATSDLSVSDGLDDFSNAFYDTFCNPKYYNALGLGFKQALTAIFTNPVFGYPDNNDTLGAYLAAYEMTFHGDPGLWLNQYPKPDYALAQKTGSSVYFTPATITPGLDSFKVNVIVTNLGKAIKKTIAVSLQRTITPIGGTAVVLPVMKKYIAAPYYIDTISFTLPVQVSSVNVGGGTLGPGFNQFAVMLDADDSVNEMTKCNNGYTISTNIQTDDLEPIYPYEFAIDSDPGVVLKASTTNPFAPLRKYDFQFDTSRLFNSPFLQLYSVNQVGGVLHWNHPTLLNKDSTVYYWRVKIDTSNTWHYSSFVHIPGSYGWQQSHFWQFTQNNFLLLKLDTTPARKFQYDSTLNNIEVITGEADAATPPGPVDFENMGWTYNNVPMYAYRMGGCGFATGITFAVIDGTSGLPWVAYNNDGDNFGDTYGNWECNSSNISTFQYGFDFSTSGLHPASAANNANHSWSGGNTKWTQCVANFVAAIPNNDYVLVYSDNMAQYTLWDSTLLTALESLGMAAPLLQNGTDKGPFIYFTKKGSNSGSLVRNGTYATGDTAFFNFMGAWYQGQMVSPAIGPAVKWGKMQWGRLSTENPKIYKDSVDIIGISNTGAPTVLRTTSLYDNSIQNISPQQYPMMQLRFRSENDSLRIASQFKFWRVIYQKPPELAINPAAYFSLTNNQNVGGSVQLGIGLENVTKIRMDSVLVKYSLTNAAHSNSSVNIRYSPMPGIDTLVLNYTQPINNNAFQGTNQLALEVNPNTDHLEQFHFNNFASVTFTAAGDSLNPLLDVTFDGQHILSGDIVSAKPDIVISLHDNNKYLPLNDSSAITVYLLAPNSSTPVHINYDNQTLRFYPADSAIISKSNKCESEFKPTLPVDGTYELLIRDADRSGNHSSSNSNRVEDNTYYDYKIDFQVINKPMISNVLNYPNPFSTSTKFIFTITGSEVPDYMRIRIMTIRGIVVKEITKDEMGPLHVGTNITEYSWDGKDQYGSNLANGVYFYQVVTRENNENMTQMSESYDQYFKKGIGKLVILR